MSGELGTPDFTRAFIKVPRPVLRELLAHPRDLAVYLAIVDRAAYNPGPRLVRGHVVHFQRGEAVFGRVDLARICSTSEQSVRTAISNLRKLGLLTTKSTSLGTHVTVVGYGENPNEADDDQPADQPANNQQTNQRSTSDQPADQPLTDKGKRPNGKKGETKKEPAPAAGVHVLRDLWVRLVKEHRGTDYFVRGSDYKLLKEMETGLGVEQTTERMHIAFTAPPSFPPQPWSLATFYKNINECAAPNEGRAQQRDVRVGRVEPETDPAAFGETGTVKL